MERDARHQRLSYITFRVNSLEILPSGSFHRDPPERERHPTSRNLSQISQNPRWMSTLEFALLSPSPEPSFNKLYGS